MQKPKLELNTSQVITQKITEQLVLIRHNLVDLQVNFYEVKHNIRDIKLELNRLKA